MRAVDTNVLVRIIVRDDARQTASADAFIEAGAWVSTLALAETISVLGAMYRFSSSELVAAVEMLSNHTSLVMQESDVVTAALGIFRHRPSVSFSDCLILQLARKAGNLPLGTFDRSLGRVEGAHKL